MGGDLGLSVTLVLLITIGFTVVGLSEGAKKEQGDKMKCSRCNNSNKDDKCYTDPPAEDVCGTQDDYEYQYVYCDVKFPQGGSPNKQNFARGCLYTTKEFPSNECFKYERPKYEELRGVNLDDIVCLCSEDGCNKGPFDPNAPNPPGPGPFPGLDPAGAGTPGPGDGGTPGPPDGTPGPTSKAPDGTGNGNPAGDPDGGVGCLQSMSFLILLTFSLAPFLAFN